MGTAFATEKASVTAWKPLQCADGAKVEKILQSQEALGAGQQQPPGLLETGRLVAFMRTAGTPTVIPAADRHKQAVAKISRILQGGSFVGAKMALDEAAADVAGFKSTAFANDFEWFLRAMSQPVPHASYPTSVRAEGETWVKPAGDEADPDHTHGFDLEQASSSLYEINKRLLVSQRALNEHFKHRQVLDYLLGYGFADPLAVRIASSRLCNSRAQLKLTSDDLKRIDVAARFMAMPGGSERPGPIPTRRPQGDQEAAASASALSPAKK